MIAVLENPTVRHLAQPLSVKGYHLLRDWGGGDVKTELIRGVVVEKMPKSPLHEYLIALLLENLKQFLPSGYLLRKESPLTLLDSEPEPDISVVKGRLQDFKSAHPHAAEWVIEVAISSLDFDREKADMYAAADIPVYWLINADACQLEVYTQPVAGTYQTRHIAVDSIVTPFSSRLDLTALFAETET